MVNTNIKKSTLCNYRTPVYLYDIISGKVVTTNEDKVFVVGKAPGIKIKIDPYDDNSPDIIIKSSGINISMMSKNKISLKSLFKGYSEYTAENVCFSLGASMKTARTGHVACGNTNATLAISGATKDEEADLIMSTELFNGITWSELSSNINYARQLHAGCGNTNAALIFGGVDSSLNAIKRVEKFDSITWSELTEMGIERQLLGCCGNINATLICGGGDINGTKLSSTEKFTSYIWTESADLPKAMQKFGITGNINSANILQQSNFYLYNGDSWVNGAPTIINLNRQICIGNSNNILVLCGIQENSKLYNAKYNGNTWSTISSMIYNNPEYKGTGSVLSALAFEGTNTEKFNSITTEEFEYSLDNLNYHKLDGISKDILVGYVYSNKEISLVESI